MRTRSIAVLMAVGLAAATSTTIASTGVASAAATFTVNSTLTTADAAPGNGVCATAGAVCTLRAALEESNALAGIDTINFNLGAGASRIAPTGVAPLPIITEGVIINGVGSPGIPRIDFYNAGSPPSYGLQFDPGSQGSTVRGLEIVRAGYVGIALFSDNNLVAGNYIGTTSTSSVTCTGGGTTSCSNYNGVYVNDASNNTIGGTTVADRNVISNNAGYGVWVGESAGTTDNTVITGNYIGTNVGGTAALANGYGVMVGSSSTEPSNTIIGGTAVGAGNVVSGNSYGVAFDLGSGTVAGNTIGLNAAGTAAVANAGVGLYVNGGANDVTVGGATAAHRNVISGNGGSGLDVYGDTFSTENITIQGNYVGLNAAGTAMISNVANGIAANPTNGLVIDGNYVSGSNSGYYAISATGCPSCVPAWGGSAVVSDNVVGLAVNGSTQLGGSYGIYLYSTVDASVTGNTVAGSAADGINLYYADGSVVDGNRSGTDVTGELDRGNAAAGLQINSSNDTTVTNNVLSGNAGTGMGLQAASDAVVTGNHVGTDDDGQNAIANDYRGIYLYQSDFAAIGGSGAGEGNTISGNGYEGLVIESDSDEATAYGNRIGVGDNGTTAIPNGAVAVAYPGVYVDSTSERATIGGLGAGEANVIANNDGDGVVAYTDRAMIRGNSIKNNGDLAIDLNNDGVTANDVGDADTGPNRLQNFPVLTSAASNGSGTQVHGTLNSLATRIYRLDFYATAACDASGNGEGGTYLGYKQVTTDGTGNVTFVADLATIAPVGQSVTATATDSAGRTSELSACTTGSAIPTVSVSPSPTSVGEAAGTVNLNVNLSTAPTATPVTVTWQTTDGTATSADYTPQAPTVLTYTAGQTTKAISVPINSDLLDEDNETFTISLSGADNTLIATGTSTVTITDDDAPPTISVADAVNVSETGGGTQSFTVSLSAASSKTVTVQAATQPGTATGGADYVSKVETVTFAPGVTSQLVTVTVNDDLADEPNETYTLDLYNPANATIADGSGAATIVDDDPSIPTVSVNPAPTSVGETGSVNLTVDLSGSSLQTIQVTWQTTDGTATSADYTQQAPTVLTYTPGQTTKAISVPITSDLLDEDNETFVVSLSNPSNVAISGSSSTVTITDNDAAPTVSIADATNIAENGGTQAFTVSLSAASGKTVTVVATTIGGTATAGSDFTSAGTLVTFPPGSTSQLVNVAVINDQLDESNETYTVDLFGATNATIADGSGSGTIVDDDTWPTITVTPAPATVGETGTANFNVDLSAASAQTVQVTWQTANGTAIGGTDFTAQAPTVLTYTPGQTNKVISVPITSDTLDEDDETFTVSLSAPSNGFLGGSSSTVTITDDDAAPTVTVANASNVTEQVSLPTNQTFTVSLSAASGKTIQLGVGTTNVTAFAGSDYTAGGGVLTFLPGETSKVVTIVTLDDVIDEFNQTYTLDVFSNTNSTIADGSGQGQIIDNEATPTVSISDGVLVEGNVGTTKMAFTITTSGPSEKVTRFDFTTSPGTALTPSDYNSRIQARIEVAITTTSKIEYVTIKGDTNIEPDEMFNVDLAAPLNLTIADGHADATIQNDD